ncbi:Arsenical pump membrane protein [Acidimicrobium ferrooxidans DSM 10331]|uniref:Arsenical pump membrane protein n=1 Tax=Acidimicrobium ferrooxidans (strain DSM 10331 / JCM 15462 / NBRC 103882 / ICP) TaxID=525909 RepID=C7M1C3_ACIFD|nr:arsenic transporter [Acidimicrobium ferrooxidans]ACU54771.1 Arsenical pump membrane protein [Acidimicrobium ferrooxidans DSM 10331]
MLSLHGPALIVTAIAIFVATLALVITQPKGLSIGWSATGGALLALALGVVHLTNVVTVWGIVWNATATFVALIVISMVLDRVGFFRWAALHVLRAAHGSAVRAFFYVLILGAVVAALFANDGAALILTPIVYEQVRALGFGPRQALPFVMAAGFIADTTSLPLIVSNLVNIVSANYFHIGFATYAKTMAPVDLVAFVASTAVLYLFYRRMLPGRYDPNALAAPHSAIADHGLFRASWVVLGVLLGGYFLSEPLHFVVSIPAGLAAIFLLLLASRSAALSSAAVLREAPWRIVVFSIGMYLVVFGLRNAGLTTFLSDALSATARAGLVPAALASGFGAAALSAVMNNLPTVLIGALSINGAHLAGLARTASVFGNVVGSDLGPKFTPIGSLATLLWLHVLETKGIKISWGRYFRQGIVLTVPVLAITLAALAGWVAIAH